MRDIPANIIRERRDSLIVLKEKKSKITLRNPQKKLYKEVKVDGDLYAITETNEKKCDYLEIGKETLDAFGAVSPQTAEEMAAGALVSASADIALSSTGIAGPDGGTPETPVGLVYLGCACGGKIYVKENRFTGSRAEIREASVKESIKLALSVLEETV